MAYKKIANSWQRIESHTSLFQAHPSFPVPILWIGIVLMFVASVALAQPSVAVVTNAADYSFTLAPGSLATIFGSGVAPSQASATTLPLPLLLSGVSVTVNGRSAPIYYVSPTQINFQIPYATEAGTGTVQVTSGEKASNALQFPVAANAAGIFRYGSNLGVIQNQDYTLNTFSNPAANGSVIFVYLTGIGLTDHVIADGAAAPSTVLCNALAKATATIGDVPAPVLFLGLTPGNVGLAQANVQIPSLPTGVYPLTINLDGHPTTSVLVSVRGTGNGFDVVNTLSLVSSINFPEGLGVRAAIVSGLLGGTVAMLGNYLYVCGPYNIHVADVTNPAAPSLIAEFGDADLGGAGRACNIGSRSASPFLHVVSYAISPGQSFVYDLSNPAQPRKTSKDSISPLTSAESVTFNGAVGFLAEATINADNSSLQITGTKGGLLAVDFSNHTQQVLISALQANAAQPATDNTTVKNNLAMAASDVLYAASTTASGAPTAASVGALDIFDVSNPANIRAISQVLIPGTSMVGGMALSGNQLLVTGNTKGLSSPGYKLPNGVKEWPLTGNLTLTMFDITNPRSPVMQGNVVVSALQPDDFCIAASLGRSFYAVSCAAPYVVETGPGINNSLVIVDARDPRAPKAYTYATIQGVGGMWVANGYLYAATSAGANIYRISTP